MMHKLLTLLLFFSFAGSSLSQEAPELFKQANQLYQQNKYEQAVAFYDSILATGLESGELYFNLGNAYYKMGKLGLARLNYERSAKFLKNDPALSENMELLKLQLVDKIQTPPKFILYAWNELLLEMFSTKMLSWIVVGLLWMVLLSAALWQFYLKRRREERFRKLFISSLIIFLIVSLLLAQKIYRAETEKFGVVLEPSVTLYAEPSSTGTEIFILHEGTKMRIIRIKDNWMEIRLKDGKTGWIEKSHLQVI